MYIENKKFLDNMLRNAPLNVFFVDNNCKIQYANDQFLKLMGYTNADEILGKEPEEIFEVKSSYIREAINTGKSIIHKPREFIDKQGNAMYFSTSCIPIIDDKTGNIIGAYELFCDITELQKKEELANQIIENMPYPKYLAFFDINRKMRCANKDYVRLTGYKRIDEIKGKSLQEILSIQNEEKLMIEQVFETKNPIINKELKITDFNNKTIYVLCFCVPIKDVFGNLFGVLEVLNDITELKNKEDLIQEILKIHQEIYTSHLQSIDCSVYVIDVTCAYLYINPHYFERFEGLKIEEILDKSYDESHKILDSTLKIMSLIVLLIKILEVLSDITELKNKEYLIQDILKTHQKMISSLSQSIDHSVYVLDINCTYLYINPHYFKQRFKEFKIEDILNKSYDKFHTPLDSKQIKEKIEEVFNTGQQTKYIYHSVKSNRYFDRILSPLKDFNGKVFAVTVFSNEITKLKNTQNSLIMKNKELEDYAYIVAHDIKTPLITIQGFVNILEQGIEQNNKEDIEESLKYIKKSILKMDELLSDTLKLSSIEYDKSSFELVSFNNTVTNAIEQLCTQIETRGVKLIKAQDFPVVFVNKLNIIEMLINLIENSIKYIGEDNQNPVIEIGYKGDENHAVFFVKDNGIGINSSQHEKIFNIFYKIDTNTKGTGVGLTIVKKIINIHNGKIWVESELGKGTTFFFTLPMEHPLHMN